MSKLWIFTEIRNATFLINFAYPAQAGGGTGLQLESWSADEVRAGGVGAVCQHLTASNAHAAPLAAVFSRYVQPHALELMAHCQALGVPALLHLDDLLHAVPADLGEKYCKAYDANFVVQLDGALGACDGVLASTATLARALAPRVGDLPIATLQGVCAVPLALDPSRRWRHKLALAKRRWRHRGTQTIGCMGSSSHHRDLQTIVPALAEMMRRRPALRFETLGMAAPEVLRAEFGDRVQQYGFSRDYPGFLGVMFELGWDLGLAPLVPDAFNAAKTYTKFVEYTSCGIPTLAQNIEPYVALPPEVISTAGAGEWVAKAEALLDDAPARKQLLRLAKALVDTTITGETAMRRLLAAISECAQGTQR